MECRVLDREASSSHLLMVVRRPICLVSMGLGSFSAPFPREFARGLHFVLSSWITWWIWPSPFSYETSEGTAACQHVSLLSSSVFPDIVRDRANYRSDRMVLFPYGCNDFFGILSQNISNALDLFLLWCFSDPVYGCWTPGMVRVADQLLHRPLVLEHLWLCTRFEARLCSKRRGQPARLDPALLATVMMASG